MMDIVEVRPNRASGTIIAGTTEYPVERCVERIAVRGAESEEYVVEDVPGQGVLLPSNFAPLPITTVASNRVLFRWVGFRGTIDADVFLGFDRARNVSDFERQVDRMETGAFNWISADATDISYRVHVLLPDRGNPAELPFTPNRLLPANNTRVLWSMDRFASAGHFPSSRGGSRGFLSSANNDPFGFVANGRTDDDLWYFGVWYDPGTRAHRIEQELTRLVARAGSPGGARITREEMQRLQLDTRSVLADELLPVLEESYGRVAMEPSLSEFRGDADLASLVATLRAWDRRMDRDSAGAVVYEGFQQFLVARAIGDEFGPVLDAINGSEPIYLLKFMLNAIKGRHPMAEVFLQGGRDRLVLLALRDTRDWLRMRFGGVDAARYRWRDLHRTQFRTLFEPPGVFAAPEIETDGSIGVVNVSQGAFLGPGGRGARMYHVSTSGAVYRMVAGFAEDGTPEASVNFVRGNSGDPTSPHWGDQVSSWASGVYRPLAFRRADVEVRAQERRTIEP
jgi:penicillin amidase